MHLVQLKEWAAKRSKKVEGRETKRHRKTKCDGATKTQANARENQEILRLIQQIWASDSNKRIRGPSKAAAPKDPAFCFLNY